SFPGDLNCSCSTSGSCIYAGPRKCRVQMSLLKKSCSSCCPMGSAKYAQDCICKEASDKCSCCACSRCK
uniref:Metallothionein n=2 Tax=Canis lupus TaxID=9612 RepID=A0A8P0PC02_CANLF